LEAFLDLLRPIPADCGLAFVLIQHLDRTRPSSLTDILSRATDMPVTEAEDGMAVEVNHVYVIPPNADIVISEGKLRLDARSERSGRHFPIDQFFRSLAQDLGPLAVGIVLSGSGNDGTQGLLAIKQCYGVTGAQEEHSAQFPPMPQSAIASGAADFILPPAEMAAELLKIAKQCAGDSHSPRLADEVWPADAGTAYDSDLKQILSMLHKATRIDFTHYKRKTLNRRIARRMLVRKFVNLRDYALYLEQTPAEIATLFREILISVTSFFREPASFDQLKTHLEEAAKGRTPGQPVRAWVAACATGEEVYSVAICLMEVFGESEEKPPIQIFGTDINESSLDYARMGIFPEAIADDVSPERLRNYFGRTDRGYQVSKAIRECCIFARHDLTRDPPFSRLDLVCCRNVLIYMGPVLQKRIIPMFHYSLKQGGLLMLGSAEALAGNNDLFAVLDKKNKIFQRQPRAARFIPDFDARREPEEALREPREADGARLEELARQSMRDRFGADGVIVNREMRIVLFRGHTSQYLDPAPGNPSFHLLRMIREDLAFKVESMVSRCIQQNSVIREFGVSMGQNGKVNLEVTPLRPDSEAGTFYLVTFETEGLDAGPGGDQPRNDDGRVAELERELAEARAHLRTIAEEHEVSLEELRAANEEVRSTNEELQSTNEELGTAKEELQSTNEELSTVNDELRTKNLHLGGLNDDLKNFFNAASLPILMVDNNLRLRRFTPAAESFLNLTAGDIGRTVTDLRLTLDVPHFKELLDKTVNELTVSNVTVLAANDRWHTVSIRPYRTLENRIEGAVIALSDIDSLKRSLDNAQDAREYSESILDTLWEPLVVLDGGLCVQRATAGFYRTFLLNREETEGRRFYELGSGQWNVPTLRNLLEDILPRNTSFEDFEVENSFPKIGFRSMRLNARRIRRNGDGGALILIAIDDVTDRREAAEIRYRRLFETAKDGILEMDGDSGDILDANPFFLQLTQSTRAELIGKQLLETGVFDDDPRLRDIRGETWRKDTVRFDGINLRARDGRRYHAELICNRYLVADENVIQCNVRDVTARKQAEDELRRSNDDLQQFAYAASHDLQEPLRMVGAYSQLLNKKFQPLLDTEGARCLDIITSSVARMDHLIKDLLVYSQTSVHETHAVAVNAEKALGLAVMNLQLAIADNRAIVTNDYLPVVKVDQLHFVQVFQNLIANAIKYRNRDIELRIHIAAELKGGKWVFSVKDNGIGFDPRYAEQIFGVFKRLHGRDYPGTGIGLSICKKIIERAGGTMWAESQPGKGSTFFFSIPDGDPARY